MSELEAASQPGLAERYQVQAELGRGGMATVYLALDLKHGRRVALKAFRPDLAAAVGSSRFLREIEITAGLNHPHVLPLLDSGEAGGLLYYVMPYVAGGSLRRLLTSDHEIPLEAVLRIVREVASALDYAHCRGVVHRDVKPENILFNEGLAVVGDFGIARAMTSAPRASMTRTGVAVGTLGYMSPEQALGAGELDSRTDVFSLGCVLYEMLTGGTPAAWPAPDDVRLGRLSEVPLAHRLRLDRLPGRVEQVLSRALALRPGDRFSGAGELAEELVAASERTPAFTDEQVRRLLDRAAELQALEPLLPCRGRSGTGWYGSGSWREMCRNRPMRPWWRKSRNAWASWGMPRCWRALSPGARPHRARTRAGWWSRCGPRTGPPISRCARSSGWEGRAR
jgi:serine/threonine-protein kinase